MRKILTMLLLVLLAGLSASAQSLYLDFTSHTDAKFFFYLNGKLLNSRSTGHFRIPNLDGQKCHLRIVVDDPYSVSLTKTFRPSPRKCEYILNFNPVRERIFLKAVRLPKSQQPNPQKPPRHQSENLKAKAPALRDEWKTLPSAPGINDQP